MSRKQRPREIVELEIESIGFEGVAIARHDNIVHFVKNAVPGDVITAEITKKKPRYAEAKIKEILHYSPRRETPLCSHFGVCGGCSWQNLQITEQRTWKRQHVADSFERLGKIPFGELTETLASPRSFHYRNKMEFSFGASRWLTDEEISVESGDLLHKDFALGLHIPGRFDKILDVDICHIAPEIAGRLLKVTREAALEFGAKAYNSREHQGFLRNIVLRTAKASGEIMVVFVTSTILTPEDERMTEWFGGEFTRQFPEISTVIHVVNHTTSPVATGEPTILKGSGSITETVLDVNFRISPFSFFQTNSWQLEPFLSAIIAAAELLPSDILWDLYCGTGSITLPSARQVERVFGLELSQGSIADAKANAEFNGITNVEFFAEDLHKPAAIELLKRLPAPDVIIVDPPRAGIHQTLLEHLLTVAPKRLVYVSCNPATQARDCAILAERYDVTRIQPVDMFPHTFHVESIARLDLRE